MRTLFSISIALIAPLVACRGGSGPSQTPSGKPGKYLIQVSGHLPTIDVVLANRAKLEQTAYDGIVVALQAGRQVFTSIAAHRREGLSQILAELTAVEIAGLLVGMRAIHAARNRVFLAQAGAADSADPAANAADPAANVVDRASSITRSPTE